MGLRGGIFFRAGGCAPGSGHEYQMEPSAVVVAVLSLSLVLSSSSFISLFVFNVDI